MPNAIYDLVAGKVLVLTGNDCHLVAGCAIGAGEGEMNLFNRTAKHWRYRQKRPDNYRDPHVPLAGDGCGAQTSESPVRDIITLPSTKRSIRVRRKQSSASCGRQTTGSFSLNDVLSSIGTPVRSVNASISW
jgi:hypothetical protein